MNQMLSYTFEMTNGFLMVALAAAIAFFAAYLWRRRVRDGAPWAQINIAAALLLYLFGDAIIRAPVWWYRHSVNHGGNPITSIDLTVFSIIVIVGAAICTAGLLYLIQAATPNSWRPWPWLVTAAAAAAFVAMGIWK